MLAMMIYVGNLDYATTSEELRALFEPFGPWRWPRSRSRRGPASRAGSAWWTCPARPRPRRRSPLLNGREHKDRALTVNESRPRRTVRDLYAGGGWFGGGHGG